MPIYQRPDFIYKACYQNPPLNFAYGDTVKLIMVYEILFKSGVYSIGNYVSQKQIFTMECIRQDNRHAKKDN